MKEKKLPICRQTPDLESRRGQSPELTRIVRQLVRQRKKLRAFEHVSQVQGPSFQSAKELISLTQQLLFPGFFSSRPVSESNIEYHLGQVLCDFYEKLSREVATAIRHDCRRHHHDCTDCQERGQSITLEITQLIPTLREVMATDVLATQEGDPAAGEHFDQIIFCYPGLYATMVQRLAHELYLREVPFLPRIFTEYAHARTGIDIHPGAKIGPSFFIDHGTGVVIGETTTIGSGVRLYQGVTLGALSLPKDAGVRLRGKKRHPTLEDGVTVYAGATILGGDTVIGAGSVIGGNVWLTESVPPGTKVLIKTPELVVINGKSSSSPRSGKTAASAAPKARAARQAKKTTAEPKTARTRKTASPAKAKVKPGTRRASAKKS